MANWSDIGEILRQTRESRGFSVHDVSHRTRIPVKALHELEEGDYSSFASSTYAKGFLNQYAQYLDLDPQDWLDQFQTEQTHLDLKDYEFLDSQEELTAVGSSSPACSNHPARPEPTPSGRFHSAAFQPIAVFAATAMLLSAGVFGFMKLNERLGLASASTQTSEAAPSNSTPHSSPSDLARAVSAQGSNTPVAPPLAVNDTPQQTPPLSQIPLKEELSTPLVIDSQPPRAVIVEE